MSVMSERYWPGVTVVLTPGTRRIGHLLRSRDLDTTGLLAGIDRLTPPSPSSPGRS